MNIKHQRQSVKKIIGGMLMLLSLTCMHQHAFAQTTYLQNLHIVTSTGNLPKAQKAAAIILAEEIKKRTGLPCNITTNWPATGNVVVLTTPSQTATHAAIPPTPALIQKPESYRITTQQQGGRTIITVEGFDARGVLYGAGDLLRHFTYKAGTVGLPANLPLSTTPDKPIRGHQLGYRNTANSYDAWTVAQYDQYIRELVVFGTNSIESIPIFEEEKSTHFKMAPDDMNAAISAICDKYGLDYWAWVPAQFDARDTAKRNHYLARMEKISKLSPTLTGIFFPGGDPGDNPPEVVWPLLKDMAFVVQKYHPSAKMWLSLQGYTAAQSQTVYQYVRDEKPNWLGGLVTGPGSPPVEETRAALGQNYQLRYYPDLTHNVRCDLPVPWWDPVFNHTLGRESVNPRPTHYTAMYRFVQPFMDGFISYSDGVHDDANKITWTRLAWDANTTERQTMVEYANFFFNSAVAEAAADALLGLDRNWQGPAATNGGVQNSLAVWRHLELQNPGLASSWRWQMYQMRANYDAWARNRGRFEAAQEEKANDILRNAATIGPERAMNEALAVLEEPLRNPADTILRRRVINLCDTLFHSIGLQTSVKKYQASGEERGAVLDFIDYPLNNRWWLEDRFAAIKKLPLAEQATALTAIANWEHPGPGSFYDCVGNPAKSPHLLRGETWQADPLLRKADTPTFGWWDEGFSRERQSWIASLRWPVGLEYNSLDSTMSYTIRVTGLGDCLLTINGQRVPHTLYGKGLGEIKEFPVPKELIKRGKIAVGFDDINEDNINWRQQSRITEVWLIKNN